MSGVLSTPPGGEVLFQTMLDRTCDKLEQKNTALILIRITELDSILANIEKRLSRCASP
ncbi:MAG: hypothetical protein LBF80_02465 [Spirochaetaceae bacterium]|jgi:hypothetical protein|nr:hypothetical protein [Spirochaetaceae bacterium]